VNTAFVFPAFITEYSGKEMEFLLKNGSDLNQYIQKASLVTGIKLPAFNYESNYFRNNELYSQLIAYIFSCAFVDVLKQKQVDCKYVAGYSMGIYASLYAAGAYRFETGIEIISYAYNLVREIAESKTYGMAAFIGLTNSDLSQLIQHNHLNVEIINVNNQHSLVTAGIRSDVKRLVTFAKEEGAMSAGELTVDTPYHSGFLQTYAQSFRTFLSQTDFQKPNVPIVSTYDQRVIISVDEIIKELAFNLTEKINWYKTMQKLIQKNVSVFYEVGAGKDLKKMSRFIKGNFKFNSVTNL
jgi:malonyl CoA-acyl carrier protein transacylase